MKVFILVVILWDKDDIEKNKFFCWLFVCNLNLFIIFVIIELIKFMVVISVV